jgi:1-acyl-sn-glycerol-3-phosphate acyltransferase
MEFPYTPVIGLARTVFFLQGLRFTILGEENVPAVGGAVMAINHTGYFDFTYAGLAARPRGRLVRFMAKKSVFGHRVTGPLMRGMKHIPVDRHAGQGAIEAGLAAVRAGEIVGIFPEATISQVLRAQGVQGSARRAWPSEAWRAAPADDALGRSAGVDQGPPQEARLRTNTPIFITVGRADAGGGGRRHRRGDHRTSCGWPWPVNLLPSRRHTRG